MMGEAFDLLRDGLDWIERRAALFLVAGLVGLSVTAGDVWKVQTRQGHDEAKTCTVQNRGLKAQQHLTNIMAAIATLLEPPKDVKAAPVPQYVEGPLATLRAELPAYTKLERKQPTHRTC